MPDASLSALLAALSASQRRELSALRAPDEIQAFLDAIPYSTESIYRAPLRVVRDRKAHCFDGACFAAAMLMRLGHPPLLVDMLPWDDDDHVIAVFKRDRRWGAVAKSNFTGLRYREPVYRDLRELLMSYFESFFNLAKNRTLRGYTRPVSLKRFAGQDWMLRDQTMDAIAEALDRAPRVELFSKAQIRAFTKIDAITFRANLAWADAKGLHEPEHG
jgi:hypothetical protein